MRTRAAVYLAAALLFTWPLALHPGSLLGSTQGPGDPYLNLWILGWDLHTLLHHPSAVLSGRVFDANIFFPAAGTLTYSDHMLLQALAMAPVYLLTGNLTLCYNVLLLASLVCSALSMHAYVREISGGSPAAWVAGLAWGFAPYHLAHLIHLQLQALYFLPLTFLFLHRTARGERWRDAVLLGVVLAAQALSSVYYGVIGGVGVCLAAVVYLIDRRGVPRWMLVRRLAAAAALSALLVAPVAATYWRVQQREGFGRSLHDAGQGSATPGSYLKVPETNLFYRRLGLLKPQAATERSHSPIEQNLFPGFVLIGLAMVGALACRRRDTRAPATALLLAVVAGFVLSLGPGGARGAYATLSETLFGFQAIRAPARFAALALFGLAGLAAFGVNAITRRVQVERVQKDPLYARSPGPFGPGVAVAAALLLALEYANAPIAYVPAPVVATQADDWLRLHGEPGAVVYLPLSLDPASNTTFMLRSLAHDRPIVNGYSGQRPGFFTALVDAMAGFPSAESVKTLLDLPVRFVVAPSPIAPGDLPVIERARFAHEVIYEIHASPALESPLVLPETPHLPLLQSMPFGVGEKSTYAVTWMSGPMSVPAGTISLEVREGQHGARYELSGTGATADWVSMFFRADDRFVSQVDDQLRPLVFEQHLREGSRHVDRRAVFNRPARSMRVQQGSGPEISLPIQSDVFDPLALFFFARTLPLRPGSTVQLPMNDSTRNYVVQLETTGEEMISYKGVQTSTVRATSRIRRASGTLPAQITLWIEPAGAKRPLRADIAGLAGVGAVRLELESGP